jgi:D-arabinan exo alpha-(1,3)/(1,5)-arabinofuranosidase (non-reducing end)
MATDRRILGACLAAGALCASACTSEAGAAVTGWDAYRRLDSLPLYRPGETARLASSYDRRGGNADGGRYACRRIVARRCVIAEHSGPGEVDSIWSTRPRAGDVRRTGTIRVDLDGRRVLDAPLTEVTGGLLGDPFAFPGVASARQASGAVWIKIPMAFRERMRITTSRNPGYVRVNYRTFDSPAGVRRFDPEDPGADVLELLRLGTEPDPSAIALPEGERLQAPGPGLIQELRVHLSQRPTARQLRESRLRIAFDGRATVDAALGELTGSGIPAHVHSLLSSQDGGELVLRWPMPFRDSALATVTSPIGATLSARVARGPDLPQALAKGRAGYLHATSRRGRTVRGRPWRVMEASGRGLLVGLSATLEGPRSQRHLEGDETILADGVALRGTGTEDFFEGGFYWFHGTRSLPLVGSPAHLMRRDGCAADCRSMYRWLVADAVPFERSLRFTFEHGDRNRVAGHYSTTALWYGP